MEKHLIEVDTFLTYTFAIIVSFIGMHLTKRSKLLRDYNIPEPVTGGIIASLASLAVYHFFHAEISFNLAFRDILLVYFFTTIGLNARFSDLIKGGRPLVILLALTICYMMLQNVVGLAGATTMGMPKAVGVLTGTAALIGGHGTAIAWSPEIAKQYGVSNALELGVASATLGLVMASLLGGPVAKWLINTFNLQSRNQDDALSVGVGYKNEDLEIITHISLMRATLVMHVAIIIGYFLNDWVNSIGIKLPLFVSCLMVAIFLSNTVPYLFKNMQWPARTRALATISDFSLGLFISMSLMAMQLWTIANLAGSLLVILAMQAAVAVLFIRFILFPLMGRNYEAAVLSAGFAGFSLGATPTAIANMTAVTKSFGPAPTAFIILPLVGAFFVDIANSFIIRFFLTL